ncbi:hypothetical protein MTR_5g084773 [Medicago truncatula]|uniref:Uncharacterized protein n=1 Tax=Medicago truncatula TaxID=3880 RepID=A0A072UFW1_MEDTR|nr:hypothetical protein MTR_5g084773 [Medicago truncatula]
MAKQMQLHTLIMAMCLKSSLLVGSKIAVKIEIAQAINTDKGGYNPSPIRKKENLQSIIKLNSDCSGKEQSREKKDKDTSSYPGSFHNTEVVQSPLHFQGDFTIITKITTAQYFLSMRLHKNAQAHTQESSNAQALSKRLLMLKHAGKRLLIKQKIQRIEFELNT